jgi:hypothetical protein
MSPEVSRTIEGRDVPGCALDGRRTYSCGTITDRLEAIGYPDYDRSSIPRSVEIRLVRERSILKP